MTECVHAFSAFLGTVSLAPRFHVTPVFNSVSLIGRSGMGLVPGARVFPLVDE